MLAGLARNFASDRAGFLGSQPEAGHPRAARQPQWTLAFGPETPDAPGPRVEPS